MESIGVVLVDADDTAREAVGRLLGGYDDVRVLAQLWRGEEAVRRVPQLRPHVVVMEQALPGMDGVETARRLLAETPKLAVLLLTRVDAEDTFFAAVRAGVSGYLIKPLAPDRLHDAIRALADGGAVLAPHLAARLVDRFAALPPQEQQQPPCIPLTPRERQILPWVVQGYTNEEIAAALLISPMTVKLHISNVFSKLGVDSRQQLAAFAVRNGLTDGPGQPPLADRRHQEPARSSCSPTAATPRRRPSDADDRSTPGDTAGGALGGRRGDL